MTSFSNPSVPMLGNESETVYFRELMRLLHRMVRALAALKLDPSQSQPLRTIIECASRIQDLAMIHGYDGVENAAHKFCRQMQALLESSWPGDTHSVQRVEGGVVAIKRLAELENSVEGLMVVDNELNKTNSKLDVTAGHDATSSWSRNKQLELFAARDYYHPGRNQVLFEIAENLELMELHHKQMSRTASNPTLDLFPDYQL